MRVDEREGVGYSVAYEREEGGFPVYVLALLAAVLLAAAWETDGVVWLALGLGAAGAAYYNFPLIEKGRPVMGANEYGIFVQGFGLIRWRAIGHIDVVTIAVRASTVQELQIGLKERLSNALVVDWRKQPFWRSLMRLPWAMGHSNVIRVNLEPFDQQPDEIQRTLLRMWRHYRS
jgi:hypothetical protein